MEVKQEANQMLSFEVLNSKIVNALKQNQLDRIRLECEMHKKIFEVEYEFASKLAEFDEKRRKIVAGEYEPTEEECKYEFAPADVPVVESTEKGIKNFWTQIFQNVDLLADMVTEHDESVLEHLTDIRLVLFKEPRQGYRLDFEFSPNDYFTNKVLSKEYYFSDSFDPTDPLNYECSFLNSTKGCKIDWKEGKDITTRKVAKKVKNKKNNQVMTMDRSVKVDSFFNFFDPPTGKMEESDEETKELLAADFDIAETLRLNVIPRAVIFYTGEAIEDDDDFDEAVDDEDDLEMDEDSDDLVDSDDDGDDEKDNVKAKRKGGK